MQVQHLFYVQDVEAQTLHRRITPSAAQREQQQSRWQDLRDYLCGDLAEATGFPMSSWLQGSYKFGTQVRPTKGNEFDIDLGIYFEWAGDAEDGGLSPAEMKALVQRSMEAYAREAGEDVIELVVPPKERCARIRFADSFHIDVPSYHLDRERDVRHLATETNGWEDSDPKALWVWFRGLFEEDDHAQVRRLIRYAKVWAALKLEAAPASILLTVLVAQAYLEFEGHQSETDDLALRNVAAAIARRLADNPRVENPVDRTEDLNRLSPGELTAFQLGLDLLVQTADRALAAPTEAETAFIWTEAFDHFFPPAREATDENTNRALVPVAFDPQVRIVATPDTGARAFEGVNRIGPIPKKCSIAFTLTNAHELPHGAVVQWMVRNEGEEAELTNDLGHRAEIGFTATENSAYRGTHFMDVVVTSALGRVLGSRRIPVQVQSLPMPARNPRRPGWTRFRRRP